MSDSLITSNLVSLDVDFDTTPRDVITHLADTVAAAGRSSDAAQLAADAYERESKAGTGVNGQVAIPHCRSAAVSQPTLRSPDCPAPLTLVAQTGMPNLSSSLPHLKVAARST